MEEEKREWAEVSRSPAVSLAWGTGIPRPPMERSSQPLSGDELYAHASFLKGLARALLRDEHRAEDLVQDTWVRALERPPRRSLALRAWLGRVVRNLSANEGRGATRRGRREERAARPEAQEAEVEALERLEIQRAIGELVLGLNEPYRTAVYLRFYADLGPSAIAERLGVPVKTVKTRLSRALAELRRRLEERPGGREGWTAALVPIAFPQAAPVAGAAGGIAGGILVAKKISVAVVAVLVALSVWAFLDGWLASPGSADEPARPAVAGLALPEPEPAAPEATGSAPEAETRTSIGAFPNGEEPTTGDLLVRVRWSDGTPAAGIGLEAVCKGDPAPREESFFATTGPDGSAALEDLFAGPTRIYVDRGVRHEVEVRAGETAETEIYLPRGIDVEGFVVDPRGQIVAGAEIWAEGSRRFWPTFRLLVRTGGDGSFRLRALDERARLGARSTGFQPSILVRAESLPPSAPGLRGVTLTLEGPGGNVSGVVLDPEGEPVAGARVQVGPRGGYIVDSPSGLRGEAAIPVSAITDEAGGFLYPGDLTPCLQEVRVAARGFPVWSSEVDVRPGQRAFIEIRLDAPARIEGRVVTATGEPVEGARVIQAHEHGGGWFHHSFPPPAAYTDAEGRFRLGWVPPGIQEVNARAPDGSNFGKAMEEVAVAPGETATVELVLDTGLTIAGRVVDPTGEPLVNWGVYADPFEMGAVYPRQDRTDADGRFLLANLGDCPHHVSVSAPGEVPIPPRKRIAEVQPGTSDLEIVVEDLEAPSAHLRGVLAEQDGGVPADGEVAVYREGSLRGRFASFDPVTGAFHFGPVLPGDFRIAVLRGERTVMKTEIIRLAAGEQRDLGILRLEAPGRIELVIRGVPEDDLAQLEPRVDRRDFSTQSFVLEEGRFHSPELAPGTWIVRADRGPWFVRDALVEVTSGVTAVIERQAERALQEVSLSLEVGDAEDPWQMMEVEVRDALGELVVSEPFLPRYRAREGVVRPREFVLPKGRYVVEAWTDTGRRASAELVVDEGVDSGGRLSLLLR